MNKRRKQKKKTENTWVWVVAVLLTLGVIVYLLSLMGQGDTQNPTRDTDGDNDAAAIESPSVSESGSSESAMSGSGGDSDDSGANTEDAIIARLYQEKRSNVQVRGQGVVVRMLPDDNEGDRHQRFIIQLDNGQTLLIAHNIDIAPRVGGLKEGDTVSFLGVYEYNEEGGTVHWTHHDPDGTEPGGWLEVAGKRYE